MYKVIFSPEADCSRPAIILDRDGVINVDTGYVCEWSDFCFIPGVIPALAELSQAGHPIFIFTNQSGIARGYFTLDSFYDLSHRFVDYLKTQGVVIRAIYFCPHLPDGVVPEFACFCNCRKPKPGMLLSISKDYGIDLGQAIIVGDSKRDIAAALEAGCLQAVLVGSSSNSDQDEQTAYRSQSLYSAMPLIRSILSRYC